MTQHIPSREQWEAALPNLRIVAYEAEMFNGGINLEWAHESFLKAASALGYPLQPPAQAQSALVKRLRDGICPNRDCGSFPICACAESLLAADHIEALEAAAARYTELRIVFDGPPSHESGRFVEVENAEGQSINAGEWHKRPDGLWELRLNTVRPSEREAALVKAISNAMDAPRGEEDWDAVVVALIPYDTPAVTSEPGAPHDGRQQPRGADLADVEDRSIGMTAKAIGEMPKATPLTADEEAQWAHRGE